jgi:dipeptidyl aminopeptidase/acylaminoacyl peptidase
MVMRPTVLLLLLAALPQSGEAAAQIVARPECDAILSRPHRSDARRPLLPMDLVRLRDIGPVDPDSFAEPLFAMSPDGHSAAFQLRRADPERNSFCLAMVIVDLAGGAPPRIVDEGSEPILWTSDFRGTADFPSGLMRVVTPRWSRDGRWFAFLKRSGGKTQVWRAFADGSASRPLTHSDVNVVDFSIARDGSSIIYVTRPGIERQQAENEKEGLDGWHFDDRFVPWVSKRPMAHDPVERHIAVLDVQSGTLRPAAPDEAALVAANRQLIALAGEAAANDGTGLEIGATTLSGGAQAETFHARLANGSAATCRAAACEGATNPWWLPGKKHVRFFRREGWGKASTAIYDWDLADGSVHRLYVTDDVLSSCVPTDRSLVCLIDSSLEPRRLVRLDPASGTRRILFDPNPEFARLILGRAERLHWRNDFGVETVGDLVLPVGYRKGVKYPLVVVQYDTRGFLRGGTDDEYPIQAFASRGYAVLSFSSPHFPAEKLGARDFEQAGRIELREFAGRRNIQSSLEKGVRLLVERGIADPKRLGITGLSDGSTTVEWELNHSSMFSAAAMSSCCWDPTFISRLGPSAAKHFLAEGYPGILGRDDPFWKDMALEVNARRISTPILVNASEEEYLAALETYTALREAGVPIDMFIYPGEFHARWQPAHRLATYKRSLDWFDYWLRDLRSKDPARQQELREWDRLRRESGHGRPI